MTVANTYTRSVADTFTQTSAKYLVSKVAADLRGLRAVYGEPSIDMINDFATELNELLRGGYVESVSYGFEKNGRWIAALNYEVWFGAASDDRPGRAPVGDASGAVFTSFLTYSWKWWRLSLTERERIESRLPFKRVSGKDPGGAWSAGNKTYSRDSVSLLRSVIG